MSEQIVCPRCGYASPVDARFCAHCGHALVSPGVRLTRGLKRILNNLSPFHIGFLGLVLSVAISVFVDRLIVTELAFPLMLVPLALVIGCGYAYLGWHWKAVLSNRSHLVRMLLVFVCMGVILVAVWWVDRGALSLLSDRTHMAVFKIPGVYRESSPGFRKLSIASSVPPYWLAVMVFGVLTAVCSNLIYGVFKRRSK